MKNWKSILALAIMPIAFLTNLVEFYFAIVFLIWSIQGLRNKTVFLLDYITKREHPVLYWVVTIVWFGLAILSLLYSEPIVDWYYGM